MNKKITKCSFCGEKGHNKRSCPQKPIDDISRIDSTNDEIIEETISISQNKETIIDDLVERQAYDIPIDIFLVWYQYKKECKLKEIRYIMDRGLNKDSITAYLTILQAYEE
jgi:hypothetical protein